MAFSHSTATSSSSNSPSHSASAAVDRHLPALAKLTGKRIALLGLGREGLSSYRFLRQFVPQVKILATDRLSLEELTPEWRQLLNDNPLLEYAQLADSDSPNHTQLEVEMAFRTPGMTPQAARAMVGSQAVITSNSQLALELAADLPEVTTLGVTGTKGKTTTTSALHHFLTTAGFDSQLGGNVGTPALDLVGQILQPAASPPSAPPTDQSDQPDKSRRSDPSRRQFLCLELSSHQLADMTISPDIAVMQMISSEHLDYFPSAAAYRASKEAIAKYQKVEQTIIFNAESAPAGEIADLSPARQRFSFAKGNVFHQLDADQPDAPPSYTFTDSYNGRLTVWRHQAAGTEGSQSSEQNSSPHQQSHQQVKQPPGEQSGQQPQQVVSIPLDELQLKGAHHLYNLLPAIIVLDTLNTPAEVITQALHSFRPVPHRLEPVAGINGVRYFNDSAATTPEAAAAAIKTFAGQPLVLLLGGSSKGADFTQLAQTAAAAKLRAVILFPPEGERIWSQLQPLLSADIPHLTVTASAIMDHAISEANRHAQPGDVVLLSPACASFNHFDNYQQRGDLFKQAVRKLAKPTTKN